MGLSVAFAAVAEKRTSTLGQRVGPLLHPASVTELEWRLVQVRLSEVEDHVNELSDSGIDSCCASYWYDPAKDKIVARFRYAPETFNRLTVQEAKQRLRQAAISAGTAAQVELERQPGVSLEEKDFEVEFVTWDEHARFKIFAVYKNGQLDFVDQALK
jgi:hypothetical protein